MPSQTYKMTWVWKHQQICISSHLHNNLGFKAIKSNRSQQTVCLESNTRTEKLSHTNDIALVPKQGQSERSNLDWGFVARDCFAFRIHDTLVSPIRRLNSNLNCRLENNNNNNNKRKSGNQHLNQCCRQRSWKTELGMLISTEQRTGVWNLKTLQT